MTAQEQLLVARAILKERGWRRGSGDDYEGRVCLEQALGLAAGLHLQGKRYSRLNYIEIEKTPGCKLLVSYTGCKYLDIWNDKQRKKTIFKTLDEAIKIAALSASISSSSEPAENELVPA